MEAPTQPAPGGQSQLAYTPPPNEAVRFHLLILLSYHAKLDKKISKISRRTFFNKMKI